MTDKHDKTNVFSFDQLEAIVDEHRKYPNETLHEILEVLNADVLRTKISYRLSSVFDKNPHSTVTVGILTLSIIYFPGKDKISLLFSF